MIAWGTIILYVLRLAFSLLVWAQREKLISEGEDREIARQAAEVARKTEFAKKTRENIVRMSDIELDTLLLELEKR